MTLNVYTAGGGGNVAVVGRALRLTRTGANPYVQSPAGKALSGIGARWMWVRAIKRAGAAPGAAWVGSLKYARSGTGAHGISAAHRKDVPAPVGFALGDTINLLFDMWDLTAGGLDWLTGTIDQWRLELDNDPGSVWDLYVVSPANRGATRNTGPLAGDDPEVTTDLVKPRDITKVTADSTAGPFLLPKKNLAPPLNTIVIHQVTVATSGYGDVLVDWFATCDYAHGDYGYFSLMVDTAPTYDGAGVINNANRQNKFRGNNTLQFPIGLRHVVTGLAAGSHTFTLFGQQDNNTPQHSIRDCVFTISELKA